MKPRVIFDRSIFHKEGFHKLKESSLARHVASDRIQLFYTAQFVEETLQYGLLNSAAFKPQWKYLTSLNDSKWFKHTNVLIGIELGNRLAGRKYYLRSTSEIGKIIQNVPALVDGKIPEDEFIEAQDQMNKNKLIREELRRQRIDLRKKYPQDNYNLEQVTSDNAEWYIEKGLMKWHSHSEEYLSTWRNNQSKCRFTRSHIRASLAIYLLPMINHQSKLDLNDKSDAEQLAFLEWGDIFVSNDTKFMKEAFDLIYHDTQKQFMNLSKFITFLNTL